jgi:SMC interacting uncharacterized protein involved in chromosome segregation
VGSVDQAAHQARVKVKKQRSNLAGKLDEDADGTAAAQAELNRGRESELSKHCRDLKKANLEREATVEALRRKHADAVAEVGDQIGQLQKLKNNLGKERQGLSHELLDLTQRHDDVSKGKAVAEELSKWLGLQLTDCNGKIKEHAHSITELTFTKQRLQAENGNLICQLEDAEHQIEALSKATTEAQMWRTKYEREGIARATELEKAKRELTA